MTGILFCMLALSNGNKSLHFSVLHKLHFFTKQERVHMKRLLLASILTFGLLGSVPSGAQATRQPYNRPLITLSSIRSQRTERQRNQYPFGE